MIDHFAAHPWRADEFYSFYVIAGDPALAARIGELQKAYDFPNLALIESDELHITVQGVGFVPQVSDSELQQTLDAARQALQGIARHQAKLAPVLVGPSGPIVPVLDCPSLHQARRALRDIVMETGPDYEAAGAEVFFPHMSLAYSMYEANPETEPDVAAGHGEIDIDAISLVRLRRAAGHYRFDEVETLALS